jgi:polysaccharide biosynthesis/export protein
MKRVRRAPRLLLLLTLALGAGSARLGAQQTGTYRIGPKDLLQVSVVELPEVNAERRITDEGLLELPVLGAVKVGGLTAAEVEDRLVALLTAKYVNRANVTVQIKEYASKPVWVGGAVAHPGPLTISGRWDLQQAILSAGGLVNAGPKISVLRRGESGLTDRLDIQTRDIFENLSPSWNIPIFPSDIVTVSAAKTIKISCIGEFKTPGVVEFPGDEPVTLLTLIARTGGLTENAARGKIRVKRRSPEGGVKEMFFNYSRIITGKAEDPELESGDVVIVKESLF